MVYTHDGILLGHEKEWNLSFVTTGMDLEGMMLSEINQTGKNKYHLFSLIIANLKINQGVPVMAQG